MEVIPAGAPLKIGDKLTLTFKDVMEDHPDKGKDGSQLLASAFFGHTGCGLIAEDGCEADTFNCAVFEIHAVNTYGANKARRLLLKEKAAQSAYGGGGTVKKRGQPTAAQHADGGTRKTRKKKRKGKSTEAYDASKVDEGPGVNDDEEWDDEFSMDDPEEGHSKIDETPRGSSNHTPREDTGLLQGGQGMGMESNPLAARGPGQDGMTQEETDAHYAKHLDKAQRDQDTERDKNHRKHMSVRGQPVIYGHTVIQLRHLKTGKYITGVPKQLAERQKNSNAICLDNDGNTNSYMVIFPLYGARKETEVVGSEDLVTFCFYKSLRREPRLYLHSSAPLSPVNLTGKAAKGKEVKVREVNSSFEPSCWSVQIYEAYVPDTDGFLRYGDPLYMQQIESGSFLAYEAEITLPPGVTLADPIDARRAFLHTPTKSAAIFCGGSEEVAKAARSNGLFAIEGARMLSGGRVNVKAPVRLRHIPTGLYMCIERKKESIFSSNPEDEAPDFDAPEVFGVTMTADRESDITKFWIRKAEPIFGAEIEDPRFQLFGKRFRLQHFFKELWVQTCTDRVLQEEPTVMQRLVKDAHSTATGSYLPDYGRELRIMDAADDYSYRDTFRPLPVDIMEMRAYDSVTSSISKLNEFSAMLSEMRAETTLNVSQAYQMEHVLTLLIHLCSESNDVDPLTRDGVPQPVIQDMFREFGVADTLLDFLGSRFLPLGTKKLADADKDPFLLRVCRLGYRLVRAIAKDHLVNGVALSIRIGFMMTQLGNDFFVADALSAIFANNRTLLEKISQEHIEAFVQLLRTRGKLPRYVQFLTDITTCNGVGIRVNQRMVAKQLLRSQDTLYTLKYDPKVGVLIGDPAFQDGEHWVPLYEFCYDPSVVNPGNSDHYNFLKAQLRLYMGICRGRAEESTEVITRELQYPVDYQMLLAALGDRDLPDELAISLCEVLEVLYVNVNPIFHVPPSQVLRNWTDMRSMKPGQEGQFEDLRQTILLFVKENYCLDARRVSRNKLFVAILKLAIMLMEFGFYYSSKDSYLNIMPYIIPLIDSRSDIIPEKAEEQAVVLLEGYTNLEEYEVMVKGLPEDNWMKAKSNVTPEMLEIKYLALEFIEQYYHLRLDYQFTRLSHFFQKTLGSSRDPMKGITPNIELAKELTIEAEKTIVPQIFLDATLYDHVGIKRIATACFTHLFQSAAKVCKSFKNAEYIVSPQAGEYYRRVCDQIVTLNTCSHKAISYKMTSGLELSDEVELRNTMTTLLETIPTETLPVHEIQRMWLLAGLHDALAKVLSLSYNVRSREGEEHKRTEIFQHAYQLLIKFCHKAPRNQESMVKHLDLIFSQSELRVGAAEVTIEVIRDNWSTCTQIKDRHVRCWLDQIAQHGQYPTYLRCMFAAVKVNGEACKQNQLMILRLILERYDSVVELYAGHEGYEKLMELMRKRDDQLNVEGALNYHILLINLLGDLCIGKNHLNKKKVAAILPLDDIIRVLKNIHTYHVVKRPFVFVLDNVYIDTFPNMTSEVALGMVALLHEYCGALQAVMSHDPKIRSRYTDPGRPKASDGTDELQTYSFETVLPLVKHYFERCPAPCMPANELTSSIARAVHEMYYVTPDKDRRKAVVDCIKVMRDVCRNEEVSAMTIPGENDIKEKDDEDSEEEDADTGAIGIEAKDSSVGSMGDLSNTFAGAQNFCNPNLVTMVVMGAQGDKEEDVPVEEVHTNFVTRMDDHKNTNAAIKQNFQKMNKFLKMEEHATRLGVYENKYVNNIIEVLVASEDRRNHAEFLEILTNILESEKKETKALLLTNFSTNQVPIVVFTNICDPKIPHEVQKHAAQLAMSLFDGGNRAAQDTIVDFIKKDGGHKFAHDLHDYMCQAITSLEFRKTILRVQEGKEELASVPHTESAIISKHPLMTWDDAHTKDMLTFISYLAMGHHQFLQDFMCLQEPHKDYVSVNIVEDLIDYMVAFEHHINPENVGMLMRVLQALTSMAEGPCKKNQKVIQSSEVTSMCFRLIDDPPPLDEILLLELNIAVVKLLYSLIEGMSDDISAGQSISYSFDWNHVKAKLKYLYEMVMDDDPRDEDSTLSSTLGHQYALLIFALDDQKCLAKPLVELLDGALMQFAYFSQKIACLEIVQNQAIERIYFHVPKEAQYLTKDARDELLWDFDRTPSHRVQGFFDLCLKRREEINHRAIINDTDSMFGRIFSVPYKYYEHIKYVQISLNLFIMFVMLSNGWADVPVQPVDKAVLPDPELDSASSAWVIMLGTLLLCTSGLQWVMYIVIHLPLVWIEKFAERDLTLTIESVQIFDRKKKERVSSLRFIVRKNGKLQPKGYRFYLWLLYYSLCDGLFVWFTAYVLICNIAYVNYFFYTVLLLDILTWCKPIKQALEAVRSRLYRLGMLLVLYMSVLLIFATYAYYYYRDDIHSNEGGVVCDVLWNCFFVILHKSLLKQGTDYVGGDYAIERDDNQERIVLGTIFYIFFGLLFLCFFLSEIITAYIELSNDISLKHQNMETICFICGLKRDDFDWSHDAFGQHVKHEHNMWSYLYFMLHIGVKTDAQLSGQEAYIRRMVRSGDVGFFPYKQTLGIALTAEQASAASKAGVDARASAVAVDTAGASSGGGGADMVETGLAVKRQTTVLENIKSAVENRGDMMLGVSRSIEMELKGLSSIMKEELYKLKTQLDMSATTDAQRIERQLQEMEDKVTNRLDRVVVVVGRATRGVSDD